VSVVIGQNVINNSRVKTLQEVVFKVAVLVSFKQVPGAEFFWQQLCERYVYQRLTKRKRRWCLKVIVLWDVALCSLAEEYRRLRGAYCLYHHQSDL
jgi:uncharacterized protein (DUF486 family)